MSAMEVSVILRLVNELSGPAKKAAEDILRLVKVTTELKKIGGGMDMLPKQLKEAGAATRALSSDVRQFSSAFRGASDAARTMAKEMGAQKGRSWMSAEVQNLREIAKLQTKIGVQRYHGGGMGGLGLLGAYYGGKTALHAAGSVFDKGAALQNEKALLDMAGFAPDQQRRMIAAARRITAAIPTATEGQNLHRLRELNYALGNRLDMAVDTLPDLAKLMTVIGASQGEDKARQVRDQIIESVKGAEIKNLIADEPTFRKWLKFQGQSVLATGGLVQPTALFQTFKYARDAVHGWTQDFFPIVSELTQEFMTGRGGGSRGGAGSSLAAFGRYFVANTYAKKVSPWLGSEGLLGKDGRVVDGHLASQNPFEWTMKYLLPAMQRDKVNLNDHAAIAQWVSHLQGTQNMRQLVQLMIIQRDQIKARIELYKKAMDYDKAYARSMETLSQNVEALSAQTTQLQAVFVGPLLGPATRIVKAMRKIATSLWSWGEKNPAAVAGLEVGAGTVALKLLSSSLGRQIVGTVLGSGIGLATGGPMGGILGAMVGKSLLSFGATEATAVSAAGATMGRTLLSGLLGGILRVFSVAGVLYAVDQAVYANLSPQTKAALKKREDAINSVKEVGPHSHTETLRRAFNRERAAMGLSLYGNADRLTSTPLASTVRDLRNALGGSTADAQQKGKSWAQSFLDMVKNLLAGAIVKGPNVSVPGLSIGQPRGGAPSLSPAKGIGHASLEIHNMAIHVNGGGDAHQTAQAVWDKFNASVGKQLSDGAFA
ncbi:MAG TPA: hypothetical protein VGV41_12460 [Pseudolabrys sp.]|uniref:hypothetical protein n=1 Tax=Pseudolabrys sp. TaxID=1960880 RepID=UPI002DDC90B8|nr:hypothetical protein [Pseudolabrys sp.]HEV2629443.1 hypothetical protein [Pseudolabrys sp.]